MKTMKHGFLVISALLAGLASATAQNFLVSLDPQQEANPAGARTGMGSGNVELSGNMLAIGISFSGLSSPFGAVHIHGPATQSPASVAGVLYNLGSLTLTSGDGLSGTINGTITLMPNPNGTTFSIAQQISQLNSGMWYVNIHTAAFPGGEIRGQILPVPEPSTWALLGLGATGLLWGMLRRRHQ